MIKKIIEIKRDIDVCDEVELSWFDMQKPNLTATSKNGIDFVVKAKFSHLHENDVLVCDEGYAIKVSRGLDTIYTFEFNDALTFAKIAYEIGNRHQPISIENLKITILDDISLSDIINTCIKHNHIRVKKTEDYFIPNGKAHHSH
jgi:urease accessory protein